MHMVFSMHKMTGPCFTVRHILKEENHKYLTHRLDIT